MSDILEIKRGVVRLSDQEIELLKSKLYELSHSAKIYLFGSRVDDTKKGGDIDILILDDTLEKKISEKSEQPFLKSLANKNWISYWIDFPSINLLQSISSIRRLSYDV